MIWGFTRKTNLTQLTHNRSVWMKRCKQTLRWFLHRKWRRHRRRRRRRICCCYMLLHTSTMLETMMQRGYLHVSGLLPLFVAGSLLMWICVIKCSYCLCWLLTQRKRNAMRQTKKMTAAKQRTASLEYIDINTLTLTRPLEMEHCIYQFKCSSCYMMHHPPCYIITNSLVIIFHFFY